MKEQLLITYKEQKAEKDKRIQRTYLFILITQIGGIVVIIILFSCLFHWTQIADVANVVTLLFTLLNVSIIVKAIWDIYKITSLYHKQK